MNEFYQSSNDRMAEIQTEQLLKFNIEYKKHINVIQNFAQSGMAPFVLFGLFMVCCFVSKLLALFVFFLFWISLVHRIFIYLKNRSKTAGQLNSFEEQDGTVGPDTSV